MHECTVINTCLLDTLRFSLSCQGILSIQKALSSLCFMKHLKSVIHFVCITHAHILMNTIRYKILGQKFGDFGELQEIHHNFLVQNFPF